MPNQRQRPVKRVVRPGFFGALKDAVEAVQSYVKPSRERTYGPEGRTEREITDSADSGRNRQHRRYGNTP